MPLGLAPQEYNLSFGTKLRIEKGKEMPYSSNLTAQEWEIIEPLLPKKKKLNRQLGQRGKF